MRVRVFALCALLAAAASPALAQTPGAMTVAPNGAYVLDQDSPNDSISSWEASTLSDANALRAKLTVRRMGSGKNGPTFGFALSNAADTVLFQIFAKPGSKSLVPLISEQADHTEKDGLVGGVFLSSFGINETIDLEATWSASGEVTVSVPNKSGIGDAKVERRTVKMRGAPTSLKIISISGEAEWKPLEIGMMAPAP